MLGYRMVPLNVKVIAKFGLYSNCLQNLDERSFAHAGKNFATAHRLGFSLVARLENIGETCIIFLKLSKGEIQAREKKIIKCSLLAICIS